MSFKSSHHICTKHKHVWSLEMYVDTSSKGMPSKTDVDTSSKGMPSKTDVDTSSKGMPSKTDVDTSSKA